MTLPPADVLSGAGIAFIALFGVWKMQVAPRLLRRRAALAA